MVFAFLLNEANYGARAPDGRRVASFFGAACTASGITKSTAVVSAMPRMVACIDLAGIVIVGSSRSMPFLYVRLKARADAEGPAQAKLSQKTGT
jgi:hypothetical protein